MQEKNHLPSQEEGVGALGGLMNTLLPEIAVLPVPGAGALPPEELVRELILVTLQLLCLGVAFVIQPGFRFSPFLQVPS